MNITPDNALARFAVAVIGRDNELTRNQSSIETSTLGLITLTNCTITRTTTVAAHGLAALQMTSAAAGDMTAGARSGGTGTAGVPVLANTQYTALASFRAAALARSCRVEIQWFTAAGASISTSQGATVTSTLVGWTQAFVTATSPGTAAFARIVLTVLATAAAAEVHYADKLSVAPGASQVWTRGGLVGRHLGVNPGLTDGFDRADNAASLGSPLTGPAWSAIAGTWGIIANRGYLASATADATAVIGGNAGGGDAILADGTFECDVILSATTNRAVAGLVLRQTASTNYLLVRLSKTATADEVAIVKQNTGFTTLAALAGAGLVNGATYRVKVEFFGGLINVYLDGVLKVTHTLSAADLALQVLGGGYGLYVTNGAALDDGNSRFDNLTVSHVGTQRITLEHSLDGGVTYETVRTAYRLDMTDPGQLLTMYDYEVPSGVIPWYRAKTYATELTAVIESGYSTPTAAGLALVFSAWWLKDPLDPTKSRAVKVAPGFAFRRKNPRAIYEPLGRSTALVVGDGLKGVEGEVTFWTKTKAEYDALVDLLDAGYSLLLQDVLGRQWFVSFGDQGYTLVRAAPAAGETSPIRHLHQLSMPFVEVAAPSIA